MQKGLKCLLLPDNDIRGMQKGLRFWLVSVMGRLLETMESDPVVSVGKEWRQICIRWIHKRYIGLYGSLALVVYGFWCKLYDSTIQDADLAKDLVMTIKYFIMTEMTMKYFSLTGMTMKYFILTEMTMKYFIWTEMTMKYFILTGMTMKYFILTEMTMKYFILTGMTDTCTIVISVKLS